MGLGQSFPNKPNSVQDAFHSPCICVQNNVGLRPRDYVRFTDSGWSEVIVVDFGQHHGVVDPFVKSVQSGHWVNIMLVPELIGRLYHNFEMPVNLPAAPPGWGKEMPLDHLAMIPEVKIQPAVVGEHLKSEIKEWVEEWVEEKVKEIKPDDDDSDWCTTANC